MSADHIEEEAGIDYSRKLVICCSRGQFSVDVAEKLAEKGYDAVSLSGGYIAWLLYQMQDAREEDFSKQVEESIRKKFRY